MCCKKSAIPRKRLTRTECSKGNLSVFKAASMNVTSGNSSKVWTRGVIAARDQVRHPCSGHNNQGGQHVINYRREQSAHTAFFHRHRKRRPPSVRRDRRGGLRRSSGGAESREGNPQAVLYWASFRLSGSATADFGGRG